MGRRIGIGIGIDKVQIGSNVYLISGIWNDNLMWNDNNIWKD